MQYLKMTTAALVVAGLSFAMFTFSAPPASATPAIAKGQPCTACHTGTPPSKANLNEKGKAAAPKK